jgi:hypothetical protein
VEQSHPQGESGGLEEKPAFGLFDVDADLSWECGSETSPACANSALNVVGYLFDEIGWMRHRRSYEGHQDDPELAVRLPETPLVIWCQVDSRKLWVAGTGRHSWEKRSWFTIDFDLVNDAEVQRLFHEFVEDEVAAGRIVEFSHAPWQLDVRSQDLLVWVAITELGHRRSQRSLAQAILCRSENRRVWAEQQQKFEAGLRLRIQAARARGDYWEMGLSAEDLYLRFGWRHDEEDLSAWLARTVIASPDRTSFGSEDELGDSWYSGLSSGVQGAGGTEFGSPTEASDLGLCDGYLSRGAAIEQVLAGFDAEAVPVSVDLIGVDPPSWWPLNQAYFCRLAAAVVRDALRNAAVPIRSIRIEYVRDHFSYSESDEGDVTFVHTFDVSARPDELLRLLERAVVGRVGHRSSDQVSPTLRSLSSRLKWHPRSNSFASTSSDVGGGVFLLVSRGWKDQCVPGFPGMPLEVEELAARVREAVAELIQRQIIPVRRVEINRVPGQSSRRLTNGYLRLNVTSSWDYWRQSEVGPGEYIQRAIVDLHEERWGAGVIE